MYAGFPPQIYRDAQQENFIQTLVAVKVRGKHGFISIKDFMGFFSIEDLSLLPSMIICSRNHYTKRVFFAVPVKVH